MLSLSIIGLTYLFIGFLTGCCSLAMLDHPDNAQHVKETAFYTVALFWPIFTMIFTLSLVGVLFYLGVYFLIKGVKKCLK